MNTRTDILQDRLEYQFRDAQLLESALTHRSFSRRNYERLEFLGDAALNLVISQALFERCPDLAEGDLSRMRATLVKGDTLAQIAQELDLGRFLRLGAGARKTGGFRRKSILADAIEAVIGAVYLDGGFPAVSGLIARLFTSRLENLPSVDDLKDAKTRLQEYLQGRGVPVPRYEVLEVTGADHEQQFLVACHIDNTDQSYTGQGRSRRQAEQRAAESAYQVLSGHE
ncbi:MAG: ribonuclease III [Pseudomonadota bacterium]|nr:ribonuclease III [Pseudomonadota bacterium]